MQLQSLHDLFVEQLQDLYSAETQLVQALPKMAAAASHEELRDAFEQHLTETRNHVTRLDTILGQIGVAPGGETCKGMQGLIEEGKEMMEEDAEPDVLDAALISAAQRVEHYEIAGYGSVRTYAMELGYDEQAQLLQQTLDEEGETDKLLTEIATSHVNELAQSTDDGEETEEEEERPSRSRRRR